MNRATVYGDHAIWERLPLAQFIADKSMTAIPRMGDRTKDSAAKTWLPVGEPIPIRIIEETGVPSQSIGPKFVEDDGTTIEITHAVVKPIGELTAEDLAGCPPYIGTGQCVQWYLALIGNIPIPSPETVVTIWHWKYLDNVTE